jgi:Uma2 family endonuclease
MITKLRPLTIADWDAIPYDEWNRYEIIEGELFVSCAPGLTHQIVATNLISVIARFLRTNPIGIAVTTPGLILSNYSGVIPDLVFFLNEKRDTIVTDERLSGPPNLVVEILSKGSKNMRRDRIVKKHLYAKHGVPEYWIIDCHRRVIEVYRLEGALLEPAQVFQAEDTVSSLALPGFTCAVSEIFEHI